MTPKLWGLALALATLFLLAPQTALAQGGLYMGRSDNPVGPTVSPYLNLVQSGSFGVTNYQSLVQPLIDQGRAIDRQGGSIRGLQQQAFGRSGSRRGTGHSSFFMNSSHFYPSAR